MIIDKLLALRICKKQNKKIKIDWWSSYMYIWYDTKDKLFKSGGNEPIDLKLLLDGNYEILPSNDKHLGGLFNLQQL
jgi:hypothetical protein